MNNRIIKFRMWDTEKKGWLLPEFYHDTASSMPIDEAFEKTSNHPKELILGSYSENPKHVLMQFVGLLDVDGEEIYEGDMMQINGFNLIVGWNNKEAKFDLLTPGVFYLNDQGEKEMRPMIGKFDLTKGKIIGNIFTKNKQLLTEIKQEK